MIHSSNCLDSEAFFNSQVVARFGNIECVARRKLLQLYAVTVLASLRVPSGNPLEALKGDRKGLHSIRVNDQWRVCFVWREDGAHQVEIVDLVSQVETDGCGTGLRLRSGNARSLSGVEGRSD